MPLGHGSANQHLTRHHISVSADSHTEISNACVLDRWIYFVVDAHVYSCRIADKGETPPSSYYALETYGVPVFFVIIIVFIVIVFIVFYCCIYVCNCCLFVLFCFVLFVLCVCVFFICFVCVSVCVFFLKKKKKNKIEI